MVNESVDISATTKHKQMSIDRNRYLNQAFVDDSSVWLSRADSFSKVPLGLGISSASVYIETAYRHTSAAELARLNQSDP